MPFGIVTSPGFCPAAQGPSHFASIFKCVAAPGTTPGIGGPHCYRRAGGLLGFLKSRIFIVMPSAMMTSPGL